jgi:L-lactate dehydrogenase complex protein LldG
MEIERFIDSLKEAGGEVFEFENLEEAFSFLEKFVKVRDIKRVLIESNEQFTPLDRKLNNIGVTVLKPDSDGWEDANLGITMCEMGISNTGTIVLFSDSENPRSFSLLPPIHIAFLKRENIVSDLRDALHYIGEKNVTGSFFFITGPSRTADIEQTLTLGVHGPRELIVILLEN